MTVRERNELLATAVPSDPDNPRSRRFNVRRGPRGLEIYDAKWTQDINGEPEFHGHPATYVPAKVLRAFLEKGIVTHAEYRRLVKDFG